jgi:hypothetical protein
MKYQKLMIVKKDIILLSVSVMCFLLLSFGFGFFFGGLYEAGLLRSRLEKVPEINCGHFD